MKTKVCGVKIKQCGVKTNECGIKIRECGVKIKVCGMRDPKNIEALAQLPIDYMGVIFYDKSPRYGGDLDPLSLDILPARVGRVGVFVNETLDNVSQKIERYSLDLVQLHGDETPQFCANIKARHPKIEVIKAFAIAQVSDFRQTEPYESNCDYLLFDTLTLSRGGSGEKFDWGVLEGYRGGKPFFLSGGISADDASRIVQIKHPLLYALDLNSRFELEPGLKNIELLQTFIVKQ